MPFSRTIPNGGDRLSFLRQLNGAIKTWFENDRDSASDALAKALNDAFETYKTERAALPALVRGDQTPVETSDNNSLLESASAWFWTGIQKTRAGAAYLVDTRLTNRLPELKTRIKEKCAVETITAHNALAVFVFLGEDSDAGWVGDSLIFRKSLNTVVMNCLVNAFFQNEPDLLKVCDKLYPDSSNTEGKANKFMLQHPKEAERLYGMIVGAIHDTGATQRRFLSGS